MHRGRACTDAFAARPPTAATCSATPLAAPNLNPAPSLGQALALNPLPCLSEPCRRRLWSFLSSKCSRSSPSPPSALRPTSCQSRWCRPNPSPRWAEGGGRATGAGPAGQRACARARQTAGSGAQRTAWVPAAPPWPSLKRPAPSPPLLIPSYLQVVICTGEVLANCCPTTAAARSPSPTPTAAVPTPAAVVSAAPSTAGTTGAAGTTPTTAGTTGATGTTAVRTATTGRGTATGSATTSGTTGATSGTATTAAYPSSVTTGTCGAPSYAGAAGTAGAAGGTAGTYAGGGTTGGTSGGTAGYGGSTAGGTTGYSGRRLLDSTYGSSDGSSSGSSSSGTASSRAGSSCTAPDGTNICATAQQVLAQQQQAQPQLICQVSGGRKNKIKIKKRDGEGPGVACCAGLARQPAQRCQACA